MNGQEEIRFSLEGKTTLLVVACCVLTAALIVGAGYMLGSILWGGLVGLALAALASLWLTRRFMKPVNELMQTLFDGISSLLDSDYSVSIAQTRKDELGRLVRAYNSIGEVLRSERQGLYQRELLLDTVIQTTPLALVLTGPSDAIIYSNNAARQLFLEGGKLEGLSLPALLLEAPATMREAVESGRDGLFTMEMEAGTETFHLSQKTFSLNTRPHRLFLFKHLTRELSRQEVETWKKVIRVIGHELNNSLAPVSSLAHSGKKALADQQTEKLGVIFDTIEERSRHLMDFIKGYSRFAKLPEPRMESVDWDVFLERLGNVVSFQIARSSPAQAAHFDTAQIEQVLINLVKNAHESGSPPEDVSLEVGVVDTGVRIRVCDRGSGMSDTVFRNALLPFYSTKRTGTGLGLPLCREVVESHGGRLNLANRRQGGLAVTIWLPDPPAGVGRAESG